jgi:hypothetical protein
MTRHVTTLQQATAHVVLQAIFACHQDYASIKASLHEGLAQMPHGKMMLVRNLALIVRLLFATFKSCLLTCERESKFWLCDHTSILDNKRSCGNNEMVL